LTNALFSGLAPLPLGENSAGVLQRPPLRTIGSLTAERSSRKIDVVEVRLSPGAVVSVEINTREWQLRKLQQAHVSRIAGWPDFPLSQRGRGSSSKTNDTVTPKSPHSSLGYQASTQQVLIEMRPTTQQRSVSIRPSVWPKTGHEPTFDMDRSPEVDQSLGNSSVSPSGSTSLHFLLCAKAHNHYDLY
jgi:hypothetical protein